MTAKEKKNFRERYNVESTMSIIIALLLVVEGSSRDMRDRVFRASDSPDVFVGLDSLFCGLRYRCVEQDGDR